MKESSKKTGNQEIDNTLMMFLTLLATWNKDERSMQSLHQLIDFKYEELSKRIKVLEEELLKE